ncbi:hypothetical protein PENTCL1PPCAC_3843 [Pristionchus entomophagus]|uniref:Uncharacterized protein n=1 Tax=Pristionchus entomophagus TaxID=358040 RepID=A0AAV5SHJ9_9BILA|nr:hypothetical protein PENTCL1PPCAC_3843 [Pristionchus entomophagus]
MARELLLLAALVAGASCFVYTCNEVKQMLNADDEVLFHGSKACVVIPAAVAFPFNDDPYTWYMYNTYLEDTDSGMKYELTGLEENGHFCMGGVGPWFIKSDDPAQFKCSSAKYKYAEITFIFTSDEPNIVQASVGGKTATYGKGTHVFVAPEGGLMIQKNSIADGKETNMQFYSGAGQNEAEERFALMPEKFVVGTFTVILGPVTTLVIEDDVTIQLTVNSFDDRQDILAPPGFDFTFMSTGRANDQQSSRTNTVVSARYDIEDDAFEYDSISITGTVFIDPNVTNSILIECYNIVSGQKNFPIVDTSDVTINADCTALEITYEGSIGLEDIGRSSEVIYLRISSNSNPVLKTASPDPDATDAPVVTADPATGPTRRTPPPTTTQTRPPPSTTASRLSSTTTKKPTTTSAASGAAILSALVVALLRVF